MFTCKKLDDAKVSCPTKYFSNQVYPRFGFDAFFLDAGQKKKIPLTVEIPEDKDNKESKKSKNSNQVILSLSVFLNLLGVSSNIFFDIRRDRKTLIAGPRPFVVEPAAISGEFSVPWFFHDENVPAGKHFYELVFINKGEERATFDNYSFIAQVRQVAVPAVFSSQFYPPLETSKTSEISKMAKKSCKSNGSKPNTLPIPPNSSQTITLDVRRQREKFDLMLYFAAEVQDNGTIRQLNFNIRRDEVSLTNGEQPLVTEPGTFAINWVTLDKDVGKGDHAYSVEIVNKGNSTVHLLAYSLIASLVATKGAKEAKCGKVVKESKGEKDEKECLRFAFNAIYPVPINEATVLTKSSVTPFKVKVSPRVRGQVLLTLNFELDVTDLNVLIFFDVRRDDGVSITNGPQPWLASFGNSGNVRLETNAVIIDPDAPKDTKFYTVEMVNQDDADVGVLYYSITSESV